MTIWCPLMKNVQLFKVRDFSGGLEIRRGVRILGVSGPSKLTNNEESVHQLSLEL